METQKPPPKRFNVGYFCVDRDDLSRIPTSFKFLFMTLSSWAAVDGRVATSFVEIARETGMSEYQIKRAMRFFTDADLIHKLDCRGGHKGEYLICVKMAHAISVLEPQGGTASCRQDARQDESDLNAPTLNEKDVLAAESTASRTASCRQADSLKERSNKKEFKEERESDGDAAAPPQSHPGLALVVVDGKPAKRAKRKTVLREAPTAADRSLASAWVTLAASQAPTRSWSVDDFAEGIADVRRKANMTEEGILAMFLWLSRDDFWRTVAYSPCGLLKKSKNGERKIDNLVAQWRKKTAKTDDALNVARLVDAGLLKIELPF